MNWASTTTFLDKFAEHDTERKEGDVKVKEGLAFLRKLYYERATNLFEKRKNSNTTTNSIDLN